MMETEEKLILVFEYCEGGQLMDWDAETQKFDNTKLVDVKGVFRGICEGVRVLHGLGIVHRDLKPQNILMKGGKPVIADFGVSTIIKEVDSFTQTEGTIQIFAPELCDPEVLTYSGRMVDVWALGVTLYCMAYGHLPYTGKTEYFIMENIRTLPVDLPDTIDPSVRELLKFILEKDPSKRPTIEQVLEHSFFN